MKLKVPLGKTHIHKTKNEASKRAALLHWVEQLDCLLDSQESLDQNPRKLPLFSPCRL